MMYDLECDCGAVSEHQMMADEMEKWVSCPECGGQICRRHHRVYTPPMIQGDTVAGNHNFGGGYDVGLGEFVRSNSHRKALMDAKGLEPYSPDPTMKKHRDERRYILENAPKGDPKAAAAAKQELKTAADTRRNRLVNESLAKDYRKMDTQ